MYPKKIYYEPEALEYELGKKLKNMYTNVEWIPIKSHNNIEELRTRSNYDFTELKKAKKYVYQCGMDSYKKP